ncbi:protein dispatched homolog 1-like [Rhopilema esculentum]|uniref:protein dispatched homolog 1-like n=1 Tax=Rhopilema esculentum TaxID=499914 RepID=UPI0031D6FE44
MEANGDSCNNNVIETELAEKSDVADFEGKMQVTARKGTTDQIRRRYASLLTKHPWIAFLTTFLAVIVAGATGFVKELGAKPLPNFSTPGKGFEARGTTISNRIIAYNNLYEEMPGIERLQTSSYIPSMQDTLSPNQVNSTCSMEVYSYLLSKTVYTTVKDGDDLFTAENLREMCSLEDAIVRKVAQFKEECVKGGPTKDCCPSLSIGYYVAVLTNKTSCSSIQEADVQYVRGLIQVLQQKSNSNKRTALNKSSRQFRILSNIMNFMVDKTFAANTSAKLSYALVFSPLQMPSRKFLENLYKENLQKTPLTNGVWVKLTAYDFQNLKTVAYDSQLLADVWYIMLAVGLILGLMWGYSGSLFISIMGFSAVVFAVILSYWLYSVVFGLVFFPFLNIMTAIFVVGIGADDIFVYVLAWRHAQQQYSKHHPGVDTITKCTEYALEHATAAMFVTSFTTATAFYAGLSSSITALQCFSIFAGTSILTNYLLMITWLPAVIIAQERFFAPYTCRSPVVRKQIHPGTSALSLKELENKSSRRRPCFSLNTSAILVRLKELSDVIFQQWIAKVVVKLRYCWVVIFFILALFGMLSLTFYPKLSLPTTQEMPLFIEDHKIERYGSVIKKKLKIEEISSTDGLRFPIIFVWGVRSVDNGYFLNPDSTGTTEWNHAFDITPPESQQYMLRFCQQVKDESLYDKLRNQNNWCFMEDLNKFVNKPCNTVSDVCCNKTIPISPSEFKHCTKEYMRGGQKRNLPIRVNSDGSVKALVFKFESTQKYLLKYLPVKDFWKQTEDFAKREISKMPKGMNNAWVISNLYFYDLQRSIADGTIKTIAVSIGISAIVLLATTQNILITLFAVIAITAIISVTIGSLVMAGWRLNVLESMMMSVAIGLSIDFTLHYGVAYFSCEDSQSRKDRVHYSLWHVGSAVAMGTLTTFLAGLVMMPSVIHAYIQVGHFLMLIMSTSWVYSTFFFLALCAVLGPQGKFGNVIHCWKWRPNASVQPEKQPAEQTENEFELQR